MFNIWAKKVPSAPWKLWECNNIKKISPLFLKYLNVSVNYHVKMFNVDFMILA